MSRSRRASGRRVLLVAAGSGEGVKADSPDRLTWGVYLKPVGEGGWTPKDAERPDEVGPTGWKVGDFERPDDPEVPFKKREAVGCRSFPASAYSFDVLHGDGNIRVRP